MLSVETLLVVVVQDLRDVIRSLEIILGQEITIGVYRKHLIFKYLLKLLQTLNSTVPGQ